MPLRGRNVVLIGYGQIAQSQHVPILLCRCYYQLLAIVDPHLDKNHVVLEAVDNNDTTINITIPVYSNLHDALHNQHREEAAAFHIAIITCPPQYAQEYAQEALQEGLHVMMEKPPGLDCGFLEHYRLQEQEVAGVIISHHPTLFTAYHSTACPQMQAAQEYWYGQQQQQQQQQSMSTRIRNIKITWKESASKWHPGQTWISQNSLGVLDILINPISMLEEILSTTGISMEKATIQTSNLQIPQNWKGPISGTTTLFVNNIDNEDDNEDDNTSSQQEEEDGAAENRIIIQADYAWNYEKKDIWSIVIESSSAHGGSTFSQRMELYDGGAQMRVNGTQVVLPATAGISTPTNTDILRPEYETLYDRFEELVQSKKSHIRITPLRIMMDILQHSTQIIVEEYHLPMTRTTSQSHG